MLPDKIPKSTTSTAPLSFASPARVSTKVADDPAVYVPFSMAVEGVVVEVASWNQLAPTRGETLGIEGRRVVRIALVRVEAVNAVGVYISVSTRKLAEVPLV